jgi:hypothetical protein
MKKKQIKKFKDNKILMQLKKLSLKNYLNILLLALILIVATYVFFSYKLIFFQDGQLYYKLAKIILGEFSLSTWKVVRGFGFPLIITLWIKIFGDSSMGLLIGTYTFYLLTILLIGYFIQKFIKKNKVENKGIFIILYILLVVFNPLIIGYSHTLLTEAVMPGIYLIEVLLCLKWYESTYKENKKKCIVLNILFILLGILVWFIKQPYAPSYFIALFISAVYSGIKNKSWKIFGQKMLTILLCAIFLAISMVSWNAFISRYTQSSSNELNSAYLTNGILGGLNVYYYKISQEEYCSEEYINSLDISSNELNKINKIIKSDSKNWCDHLIVYEIRNNDESHVKNEVVISKDKKISLFENGVFLIKNIFKHPSYVLRSYFYNYLAIVDIQERDLSKGYRSSLEFSQYIYGENISNGMWTFQDNLPTVIEASEMYEKFNDITDANTNKSLTQILWINNSICFYLFKILCLLALPIFIYGFIKFILVKKINYFVVSLLSLMTFTDAFFNVFMGAIIDRYVYAVYPLMLLCMFILFMEDRSTDKNEKKFIKYKK